jgi:Mg2+-importing ATPase
MIWIGPVSSIFDYTTYGLMLFIYHCSRFTLAATPGAEKSYYESLFHTGWFVESLMTQTLIVHIIRTNRIPFIQSSASLSLTLTTLAVMAVAVYLPFSPLAHYLGLVALPNSFWPWLAATLLCYCVLTHWIKTRFIKWYGTD